MTQQPPPAPVVATAAVVLVALALLAGCGGQAPAPPFRPGAHTDRLGVVATTPVLADFARTIGGARVDVYDVVKANVDPHDYEPAPADINAIALAGVVAENGAGLEHWFTDTIKAASPRGIVVDTSQGVRRIGDDPHIWHDPANAKRMAENLEAAMERADPAGAPVYRANFTAFAAQIDELDATIATEMASLRTRKLVTNHDSLAYFVTRYDLDFVGSVIPSFDTSAELSSSEVDTLVRRIRDQRVGVVFSESSLPAKTARAIAGQAGVRIVQGDQALYGDSLGPPGSDGDTYLKMEAHNARMIAENLR
jgi:ABC-type Zn uptake system ZnuABC Zn-binding protein ZnuA